MQRKYDIAIIGGGPGGYVSAIKAGMLGMKVCCIEQRKICGGTCLNEGCIPSKTLLHITEEIEKSKQLKRFGIELQNKQQIKLNEIVKEKNKIIQTLGSGINHCFKKRKVEKIEGKAKFINQNTLEVINEKEGKKDKIIADNIIIATGSKHRNLPYIKCNEDDILSNVGALNLNNIPKNLTVIGGGVIGLELGTVYQRLGSKVTIVEYNDSIANGQDVSIQKMFTSIMKRRCKLELSQKVNSIERNNGKLNIILQHKKTNEIKKLISDKILVSIGRIPNTNEINFDKIGGIINKNGTIEVDEFNKTNIPNIYAIGDVCRGPMLAHKAESEGINVVEYIHKLKHSPNCKSLLKPSKFLIPGIIYTDPEISSIGLTEQEVRKMNIPIKIGLFDMSKNSRGRAVGSNRGLIKVISNSKTGKILGVHMLSNSAGEMIHSALIAMENNLTVNQLKDLCFAHPTFSEGFKEALEDVDKQAIHS